MYKRQDFGSFAGPSFIPTITNPSSAAPAVAKKAPPVKAPAVVVPLVAKKAASIKVQTIVLPQVAKKAALAKTQAVDEFFATLGATESAAPVGKGRLLTNAPPSRR